MKDSFSFVETLREQPISNNAHMCSFDVVSLFTNVPQEETVDICADALYRNEKIEPPSLTEKSFQELLFTLTSGVEFSFNDIMYRQSTGLLWVVLSVLFSPIFSLVFVSLKLLSRPGRLSIVGMLMTPSRSLTAVQMLKTCSPYLTTFTRR